MANEYLKRTPTSSGNRKVFTWSGWVKKQQDAYEMLSFSGPTTVSDGLVMFGWNSSGSTGLYLNFYDASTSRVYEVDEEYRDFGSWLHYQIVVDTTQTTEDDRVNFYINGVQRSLSVTSGYSAIPQDYLCDNMTEGKETLLGTGRNSSGNFGGYVKSELSDIFFVDGQALTPDVFGFYKDGDGYISSGNTNATDFRPGQWMPHSPAKIKKDINRRGGFGTNGFYLPMNDSSNPGADFHCDPNSIITLKGEDLPQPRNGAPTTSDAYVSELRQEAGTLGFDGAVKFDGTDDYLSIGDSSDWDIGTAAFTLEGYVLIHSNSASYSGIFGMYTGSTQFQLRLNNVGRLQFLQDFGGTRGNTDDNDTSGQDLRDNKWHHIAMVRKSDDTWQLYVDGVLNYSGTGMTGNITGINEVALGRRVDTDSFYLNGFISNFRFVSGSAVYPGSFTPPTEQLTAISNTKLLCCNSSTSATASTITPATITANGGAFATRNELTGSIVLAVPGISTSTSANLVTNGTFDSNVSNWTAVDATITWSNGRAQTNRTGGSGYTGYQAITVESGKRYTVSGIIDSTGTGDRQDLRILDDLTTGSPTIVAFISGTDNEVVQGSSSFTASQTTYYVYFVSDTGGTGFFDNIVVKQEDAPRDYSADIKGSGSNKTLTPYGSAGVGYELGNYYGSAMTFDGDNDYLQIPHSEDFNMGTGEFTLECWVNSIDTSDYQGVFGSYDYDNAAVLFQISVSGKLRFVNPNQQNSSGSSDLQTGQWNHIVMERYNGRLYGYVNGVAEINTAYTNSIDWGHSNNSIVIGVVDRTDYPGQYDYKGQIQDLRLYKGVAKYKGGFDVPKPYAPVGFEGDSWRTVADNCKNNFATFNPLLGVGRQDQLTYTKGNLKVVSGATGGSDTTAASNMAIKGKIYCEFSLADDGLGAYIGIMKYNTNLTNSGTDTTAEPDCWIVRGDNEHKVNGGGGSGTSYGSGTWSTGDIIMLAVDIDNTSIWWGKNGTWYASGNPSSNSNAAYTNLPSTEDLLVICGDNYSSETPAIDVNFGQNPTFGGTRTAGTNTDDSGKGLFKYAPPSGFLALCEDNLPTPAIADPGEHFKCVFYSGDNSTGRRISDVGFQPDLVWIKARNATPSHILTDSVRGIGHQLSSDDSGVEVDSGYLYLTNFANNGFELNDGANSGGNTTGRNYVAWCWKAGGPAVANNDGSRTTQVSVNRTAGFSIGTFTGDVANTHTIGHGLGKVPAMIIVKERTGNSGWGVYHKSRGNTKVSYLNSTDPEYTESGDTASWNTTDPTSSVFSVGKNGATNDNTLVFYAWAEIEGYSKFGSYVGNGNADGPFVYCGFKPAWVMVKRVTTGANEPWPIFDSSRGPDNPNPKQIYANSGAIEGDASGRYKDFLSNGFKPRGTSGEQNTNGITYIFAAFAESPFQTANAK